MICSPCPVLVNLIVSWYRITNRPIALSKTESESYDIDQYREYLICPRVNIDNLTNRLHDVDLF